MCNRCLRTWLTILVLGLLGCGKPAPTMGGKAYEPRTSFSPVIVPPTGAPATPPMSQAKPVFTISAQQFHDECRQQKEAKAKFAGKVIELAGTVQGVGTNPNAQPILFLSVAGDPLGVMCIFFNTEMNLSEQVSKGQQVRVRGVWPREASVAGLADCVLVGR
jgi:hypothetical protein